MTNRLKSTVISNDLGSNMTKRQERVAVCEMVRKAAADEGKAPVKFSDKVMGISWEVYIDIS